MALSDTAFQFFEATRYLYKNSEFESQKALAYTAGVTPSVVNDILKERRAYGPKTQEKIAAAFGLDLIELLTIGRDVIAAREDKAPKKPQPKPININDHRKPEDLPHDEIIARFKHKEWARKMNAMLLEIESDADDREIVENVLKMAIDRARAKKSQPRKKS